MKVNLGWLNELIDLSDLSIDEIVNKISLYSVEVEEFGRMVDIDNLVVGRVMIKEKHPNADKLSVCTVNVGEEVLQIVCGAPNVEAGQDVIVAKIGAVLPGDFKIKKSKIRGVESFGMICSLKELGIESKYISEKFQDGIFYFEEEVKVGDNPLKALGWDNYILDLSITPDRGDLLSMLGMAYEMSALFNRPLKPLAYSLKNEGRASLKDITVNSSTSKCLTYYARVFSDVVIKPSPSWLTSRLIAFGIRPINNVVDITNYILALFGQPLHAFDYAKLGNKILVRQAHENEEVITLDNVIRKLNPEDIVITNEKDVVAIAGVMGALNTEVTSETTTIVLEAAVFDSSSVRKTSNRLNLRSESSIRFGRGIDINRTKLALDYASYLLETLADAKTHQNHAFVGTEFIEDRKVNLSIDKLNRYLGTKISKQEVKDILSSLGFKYIDGKDLTVLVPYRRLDIVIEEDLIEEIIRIYGYDNLPLSIPKTATRGNLTHRQHFVRLIKDTLTVLGSLEVINYTLLNDKQLKEFNVITNPKAKPIKLLMPLSEERSTIRFSLLPNIIENVKYNFARKNTNINFFEIGDIYYYLDEEVVQETLIAGALANDYKYAWNEQKEVVDFYLVKGILDVVFKKLNCHVTYETYTGNCNELHPNKTALIKLDNKIIGYIGEIHPQYAQANDIENVYVFEVKLDGIINQENVVKKFTPIPKHLDVQRDLAMVVERSVEVGSLIDTINQASKFVSKVQIFDIYMGEKVKATEKSVAVKIFFTSNEPLTDDIINQNLDRIIKALSKHHNARLRD